MFSAFFLFDGADVVVLVQWKPGQTVYRFRLILLLIFMLRHDICSQHFQYLDHQEGWFLSHTNITPSAEQAAGGAPAANEPGGGVPQADAGPVNKAQPAPRRPGDAQQPAEPVRPAASARDQQRSRAAPQCHEIKYRQGDDVEDNPPYASTPAPPSGASADLLHPNGRGQLQHSRRPHLAHAKPIVSFARARSYRHSRRSSTTAHR